jgi:hypothetical protein
MKQLLFFLLCIPQLLFAQSNWCGTPDRMLGNIPSAQEQDLMKIIRNNMQKKSGNTPYKKNASLFYLYDDGTVDKKIILK